MTETIIVPKTETEKLFQDLSKPSLHALSYALRHPDTWPKNFDWDYSQCDHCAMGLAHTLWDSIPRGSNNRNQGSSRMAKAFGMPFEVARSVFFGGIWAPVRTTTEGFWRWKTVTRTTDHDAITPEMVADQIDKYLETAE